MNDNICIMSFNNDFFNILRIFLFTRASKITTSARPRIYFSLRVIKLGSPGPALAKMTDPFLNLMLD